MNKVRSYGMEVLNMYVADDLKKLAKGYDYVAKAWKNTLEGLVIWLFFSEGYRYPLDISEADHYCG